MTSRHIFYVVSRGMRPESNRLTAFKTLSMRIRGANSSLIEAGLDTDGMASSISTLRSEIEHLTGVDIMIDDSTFKSTYDILKEISEVWDTLEDVDQANVIELIAGKLLPECTVMCIYEHI